VNCGQFQVQRDRAGHALDVLIDNSGGILSGGEGLESAGVMEEHGGDHGHVAGGVSNPAA